MKTIEEGLINRFREQVSPFIRSDDFYGNILIPSLIGNQKGRLRPIINRRPFFLYKEVALSSPEVILSLKRAECDILNPLAVSVLEYDFQETDDKILSFVESIFRFLIICGNDQDALDLVCNLAEKGLANQFLLRSVSLLYTLNQSLNIKNSFNDYIGDLNYESNQLLNWLTNGQESDFQLAGESISYSKLYFQTFQRHTNLQFLKLCVGDLSLAAQRVSTQKWLSYSFQSFCSSGQLFLAFQLGTKIESNVSSYFLEELFRISLANDRIRLYRKLQRNKVETVDQFRLSIFASLYGETRAKLVQKLLSVDRLVEVINILPTPEVYRRDLIEDFEELMLVEQLPDWFIENRRYLASYAGEDFRIRGLLAYYYSKTYKNRALELLITVTRPILLVYTFLKISENDTNQIFRKRIDYLRKVLERASNKGEVNYKEL